MLYTEPGSPLPTALAIALGAAKVTDITKELLVKVGFDKIPAVAKMLTASALAIGGSVLVEDTARRRVLTAAASAGLAGMLHSWERAQRWRADLDELTFYREGMRRR